MMRQFLLFLFVAPFLFSCKKNITKSRSQYCDTTMVSMAGSYHLAKVERVIYSTGIAQDVTTTISSCELLATYTLKQDSTATYIENGTCTDSGIGNWQFSNNNLFVINFKSGNARLNNTFFYGWDCTNLVLMTAYPTTEANYRYTLTRF